MVKMKTKKNDKIKRIATAFCALIVLVLSLSLPLSADTTDYDQYDFPYGLALKSDRLGEVWNADDYNLISNKQLLIANKASLILYYSNGNIRRYNRKIALQGMIYTNKEGDQIKCQIQIYDLDGDYVEYYSSFCIGYDSETGEQRVYSWLGDADDFVNPLELDYFVISIDEPSGMSISIKTVLNGIGFEMFTKDGYELYWNGGYYVGYDTGYDHGKADGVAESYPVGREDGYKAGYDVGRADGFPVGYAQGKNDYESLAEWANVKYLLFAILDAPFYVLSYSLNFELLGINIAGTLISLISLAIIVFILKIILVKIF